MESISLRYGDGVLPLRLPDSFRVDVLSPKTIDQSKGDEAVIESAMNQPIAAPLLHNLVRPGMNVAVIVDDLTRPTPIARMLPVVLRQLAHAGLSRKRIKIVVALGTHRPLTTEELQKRLGGTIASDYVLVNVDCQDRSQFFFMGNTSGGVPARINRTVSEAELRIGLGMIVPHTDTGFSGGAKIILPGVCAHDTIIAFHMRQVDGPPVRIGNETAPLRLELERFVAEKIPLDFILNVVLDVDEKIYAAVAGHYVDAHRKGCRAAEEVYGIRISLVSYGLTKADADMMKFAYFESLETAVQSAHEETGGSDIAILTHGGISWPYLTRPDIS